MILGNLSVLAEVLFDFICCDGRHTETATSSQTPDTSLPFSQHSLQGAQTVKNKQNIEDITVSTSAIVEFWDSVEYAVIQMLSEIWQSKTMLMPEHIFGVLKQVCKNIIENESCRKNLSVLVVECWCQSTCALTANDYSLPLRDWKSYPKFILGCSPWMFWVKRLRWGLLSLLYNNIYNLKPLDNFATLQNAPCFFVHNAVNSINWAAIIYLFAMCTDIFIYLFSNKNKLNSLCKIYMF